MAKRQKKQRLKLKKTEDTKKKRTMTWIDYLIFTVGGIAAVIVAVWGGYYLGQQSTDTQLTPEIRSILGRVQLLQDKGNFAEAERILILERQNFVENEHLALQLARVYVKKGEVASADSLVHEKVISPSLRRAGLQELRDAYRAAGDKEKTVTLAREMALLDEQQNAGQTPIPVGS